MGSTTPTRTTSANPTQFLPSNLITEGSETGLPTATTPAASPDGTASSASSSTASASPTPNLPYQISPQTVPRQANSQKRVEIGFKYPLNYRFVAKHGEAAAQIFNYVPEGVAQALGIDQDNVVMIELDPYQNTTSNFLQTVAKLYVPKNSVSQLQQLVSNRTSALYTDQSDPSVLSLMQLIDDYIPVNKDLSTGDGSGSSSGGSKGGDEESGDDGKAPGDHGVTGARGSLDQAAQQDISMSRANGKVAGIAIGTVVGASVVAAALFVGMAFLRSRFRRPPPSPPRPDMESYHDDASSLSSGSRSGAPSGATSAAPPPISFPIVAENSLGWH